MAVFLRKVIILEYYLRDGGYFTLHFLVSFNSFHGHTCNAFKRLARLRHSIVLYCVLDMCTESVSEQVYG